MKKILFFVLTLLLAVGSANAYRGFSVVSPSGHTLYYDIDANGRGVSVCWPNYEDGDFWAGVTKPVGRVVIPSEVTYTYVDEQTNETISHTYTVYCVGQNCFNGCTGITTVVFPETIIAFEPSAFAGCTSMDSIIMPQVPPELFAGQPIGMNPKAAFYIPCGTYDDYQEARYGTIHTGHGGVVRIEPEAEGITLTLKSNNYDWGYAEDVTPGTIASTYYWYWGEERVYGQPQHVRCDSMAILSVMPAWGYRFDHWDNGMHHNVAYPDNGQGADTIYLSNSMTITAYFVPRQFELTLQSNDDSYGTVTGGGSYTYLDTVEITATAAEGYRFEYWSDYSTDPVRSIVIDDNKELTAYFVAAPDGIDDVDNTGNTPVVFAREGKIVFSTSSSEPLQVSVFNIDGRVIANGTTSDIIAVPASGAYLVKIGDDAARKVVVVR